MIENLFCKENRMKFESQLLKGIAPVVVLEILSRGKMYGYELSEAIEQRSDEILTLGKGTLYPLLYNLEARKLVSGNWENSDSDLGRFGDRSGPPQWESCHCRRTGPRVDERGSRRSAGPVPQPAFP